jgi:CSLREA domain-containing protein
MRPIITQPIRFSLTLLVLIILLLPSASGESGGSGWWVNTNDDLDDGLCDDTHCSLREAINISNTTAGQQIITFDIPGASPHTIELCDTLPAITDPVLIDGTLEPDYPFNGGPVVAIAPSQGTSCSPPPYGLWFDVGNSVVRGISVVGFDQPGASVSGGIILHAGNGSLIERDYIGLLPGGTPWGNRNGILLGSATHQIAENVISGNTYGIHALLGDHTIDRNHIGTNPDATATSLDHRNTIGIYIEQDADNNQIGQSGTGNVISGNGNGIYLASQGNQIQGNKIGTNQTGTSALGNSIGIHASLATYTIIGGTDPGETNLISGNTSGIALGGYSTLQGNFIGTDFSGSTAIPNQIGISVQSASYVLIGGTGTGQGNLISGNSNAGVILHDTATHVEVVRNKIGTDITGAGPLGNGRGIFIQGNGNFIGHVATGGGNTIAYNADEGILLAWSASQNQIEDNIIHDNGVGVYAMDAATSANPFTQNDMYANAALGIDLAPVGVNLNDPGDTDTGANQRLNYPEFTSTSTTVAEGTACHGCTVEVYRSDQDPSNHGEGESLLASVVAGPFGDFSLTFPSPLATCDRITATSTDVFGNTSEFSPNRAVGLCIALDPSWFFLIEIAVFIIPWFGVLLIRRRAGRPVGSAAASGGAVGFVIALGTAGLMYALPNVELNFPRGGSPEVPVMLPACEQFLVPGSLLPFEGARGLPIDPYSDDGEHGMPVEGGNNHDRTLPVDQLESFGFFWGPLIEPHDDDGEHRDGSVMDDGEHGMPIDPYGQLAFSWMPIDPLKDDGEHGDGSVMDDGQHGDGIINPLADDGEHGDGAAGIATSEGVQWQVDLLLPTGEIRSRLTIENAIALSAFGIESEWLMDDGQHGDSAGTVMDDGEHGDSAGTVMDDGEHGDSAGSVMDDGEHGDSAGTVMDDGEHGDGMAGEGLMIDSNDWDAEPLFWRLTGLTMTENGSMQPFCQPTNWLSFQLGAPQRLLTLPWSDAAPPPPAPPLPPPEPTPVVPEEEPAPAGCLPTVTATINLTCRFGPASAYQELGYLLQGESATVEGRNTDSTWWYIPNPDWQGYCWVWDGGVNAICIPEDLPAIAAPPLPTPTPTQLACQIDLGKRACASAGGTYVDGGATSASYCQCP